jgi:D-glycero-beta-D-manno-heptose-7-phosphate kinase
MKGKRIVVIGDLILDVYIRGVIELLFVSKRPTTEKTRVLANNQQVLRIDRENGNDFPEREQQRIIQAAIRAMKGADGIIFEDYNKGLLSKPVIRAVLSEAQRRGIITTVDPKFTNFFEYKGVSVIKPNLKEVSAAMGSDVTRHVQRVGFKVMDRLKCSAVLLTRSAEGMTLFEKGERARTIPTVAREVFDVSGAGDTVISVLTLALAAGGTLFQAATLANVAAGLQVQKRGAVAISAGELRSRILEA